MNRSPWSVSELTLYIQTLLEEDRQLADIWVFGEVLESTYSSSGHHFFSLVDDESRLRCVMFRASALRQRYLPTPGSSCAVHGHVSVYPRDGSYQIYVDLIQDAGVGLASLELELLKLQLEAEGLFEPSRKRPLPESPSHIGVVTSISGAVWHDIMNVVRRRYPFTRLLLAPATVQGTSSPESLIAALQSLVLDGRSEVIIIARGGGSAGDLAAFNDERLVRSVFASPVPVISAVGHETDWTLIDLVADVRAPTPTAAAELSTPSASYMLQSGDAALLQAETRLRRDITLRLHEASQVTDRLVRHGPASRIAERQASLVELARTTKSAFIAGCDLRREALAQVQASLERLAKTVLSTHSLRLWRDSEVLKAISPPGTLQRGYAFVSDAATGAPIRSADSAWPRQRIVATLHDGSIDATVDSVLSFR